MNRYLKSYRGFTLIELVIVIFILGILVAVATPKLITITSDAQNAVTLSVAGALSSANAENYSVRVEKNTNGLPVTNCTSVGKLLVNGLPSGYTIKSKKIGNNVTITCTLKGPSSTQTTFIATGIL